MTRTFGTKISNQITRKVKFTDREKAVKEACREHAVGITSKMNAAINRMAQYLNNTPSKINSTLNRKDVENYYSEVEGAIDVIFSDRMPESKIPDSPWDSGSKSKSKHKSR